MARRSLRTVFLTALVLAVGAVGLRALLPRGVSHPLPPPGISRLDWVPVPGGERLVLQRGAAADLPVVLFLHGGPGASVTPGAAHLHRRLEPHALLAHWDQPGAPTACPTGPLTIDQLLDEAEAVAEWLAAAHGRERIGLYGASWGTVLGLQLAQRRPDLFWGYAAEGQVLDVVAGEHEAIAEARRRAAAAGDTAAVGRLERIRPGQPGALRRELVAQGMIWQRGAPYLGLVARMALGREHTLPELLRTPLCMGRAAAALHGELRALQLDRTVTKTAVPTVVLQGRHDYLAPPGLVADWAGAVGGAGATVVWFEDAGHVPSLEQPTVFADAFVEDFLALSRDR